MAGLCNRGKCCKEMRLLQTSLLGQLCGPKWKFVLRAESASKHLRKPPRAFSCQLPSASAEQPAVEVPGAQEPPWQRALRPWEPARGLARHGGLGRFLCKLFSQKKGTQETAWLRVGKRVRMEQRAPGCTPACKGGGGRRRAEAVGWLGTGRGPGWSGVALGACPGAGSSGSAASRCLPVHESPERGAALPAAGVGAMAVPSSSPAPCPGRGTAARETPARAKPEQPGHLPLVLYASPCWDRQTPAPLLGRPPLPSLSFPVPTAVFLAGSVRCRGLCSPVVGLGNICTGWCQGTKGVHMGAAPRRGAVLLGARRRAACRRSQSQMSSVC